MQAYHSLFTGNCLTVGLGGHVIGGGVGYFSTTYCMALDSLLEVEKVDARGTIVTANNQINSELYWALGGIGPGYIGIVTSLTMKAYDAKNIKITSYSINYPLERFAEVWEATQNFVTWAKFNDPTVFQPRC